MIDVIQDQKNIKTNYHCKVDFIIVEISVINQGTFKVLQKLLRQSKATKLLCAYDFGKESDIAALTTNEIGTTKLPLNHSEITKWCSEGFPDYKKQTSTERLLTDQDINNIVLAGNDINCESSTFMSKSKLSAFEKYSSECESRNTKDAEIHKDLESASAKARFIIEEVMIKLTKVEGIRY